MADPNPAASSGSKELPPTSAKTVKTNATEIPTAQQEHTESPIQKVTVHAITPEAVPRLTVPPATPGRARVRRYKHVCANIRRLKHVN